DLTKPTRIGNEGGWVGRVSSGRRRLTVGGRTTMRGQTRARSAARSVSTPSAGTVTATAGKVSGGSIPGANVSRGTRSDSARTIGGLPEGLDLENVEPTPEGIELSVRGKDVNLSK